MPSSITNINLLSLDNENTIFAKELYTNSFPQSQRRLWSDIISNTNSEFAFYVIEKDNKNIGIISVWTFKDFVYIEHFAISPTQRNKGYGGQVIDLVKYKYDKAIVLEVELPQDTDSIRRVDFYQSKQFTLWDNHYIQPPYYEGLPSEELKIMTYNNYLSFFQVRDTLYKQVYKY